MTTSAELDLLLEPDAKSRALALRVQNAKDVAFPVLKHWNYEPCKYHDKPVQGCEHEACGGQPFAHQRIGATWLYLAKRGVIADVTGSGKTANVFLLLAMLKERGELTDRCVVVCQPPAVEQWARECNRWLPKIHVETATGSPYQRRQKYMSNFDVLVVGYQMLLQDIQHIAKLQPGFVVSDDVDPLRNEQTATAKALVMLSYNADRFAVLNATPLQIKLEEWWSTSRPVGGEKIFGNKMAFERRYCKQEQISFWDPRTHKKRIKNVTNGYKNIDHFKTQISPLVLRRTYEDLEGVDMPDLAPAENVWLDMHKAQRAKYEELQEGVLRLMVEEGETVKHATALTKFTYGQQICAGLPALGEDDGPESSAKLDWLMDKITGDWYDQKIIVYMKNVGMVRALDARCKKVNAGTAKVWGQGPEATTAGRAAEIARFKEDKKCRVMMGTSSLERSLNLQVSNIVVNLDTLLNPQRMIQILGRARRAGSKHKTIFSFNLLHTDSQEDAYPRILAERAALVSAIWEEEEEVFEKLSPLALLELIRR